MLPASVKDGLDRYVNDGIPTGDFLRAVLTNDLFGAMGRADEENRANLFDICSYVWDYLPIPCWGSADKVNKWIESHRKIT